LCILSRGTKWRWVVCCSLSTRYSRERDRSVQHRDGLKAMLLAPRRISELLVWNRCFTSLIPCVTNTVMIKSPKLMRIILLPNMSQQYQQCNNF